MSDPYITNTARLAEQLSRFTSFVRQMDGRTGPISFRDRAGFLGREEDYKSCIAEEARKALKSDSWRKSWIGTGKIAACARAAIRKSGNLVHKNQQIDFRNRLDPRHAKFRPDAERALYELYRNDSRGEAEAFAKAVEVFGAKYDTVAFLFYIKDDTSFLPISTGHFDRGFAALGIDYTTSFRCGWENYLGFNEIIKEIRAAMDDLLPMRGTPRLIDAHSFVWVIQEDSFLSWEPDPWQSAQIEETAENYIQRAISGTGGRRSVVSSTFVRSAEVVRETRRRAHGICELCHQPAPFLDKKGEPYLETHHIVWLSRGGEDSTDNTAALCPNCHTRMHILDAPEDIEKLKGAK